MGIFPTLYEEDDLEVVEDGVDIGHVTSTSDHDLNLDILEMGGLENYLNGQMANATKPKLTPGTALPKPAGSHPALERDHDQTGHIDPVPISVQSGDEEQGEGLVHDELHKQPEALLLPKLVNSQKPGATVASMSSPSASPSVPTSLGDYKRGHEATLIDQVIQEHSYAKLGSVAKPSLVVNSHQPRATVASMSKPSQSPTAKQMQKLFDAIPKIEAVVKQEPGMAPPVKAGSLPSPDVKPVPVLNTPAKRILNPNVIDMTNAVSSNPELIDLLTSFEEETSDNNLLVDWPMPIYLEDYKVLAEGEWLNTNVMDFYLQHLYSGLPTDLQAEVFVFETTFFSVLRDCGIRDVSSYFPDTNFFDKELIKARLETILLQFDFWLRPEP